MNYHHKQRVIRIHAYFGQLCKTLVVDKTHTFDENFLETLRSLGITCHPEKYVMKLVNGGVVDSNEALMSEDRVMILPVQEVIKHAAQEALAIKTEAAAQGEDSQSKALMAAINSVHMGNFH